MSSDLRGILDFFYFFGEKGKGERVGEFGLSVTWDHITFYGKSYQIKNM